MIVLEKYEISTRRVLQAFFICALIVTVASFPTWADRAYTNSPYSDYTVTISGRTTMSESGGTPPSGLIEFSADRFLTINLDRPAPMMMNSD